MRNLKIGFLYDFTIITVELIFTKLLNYFYPGIIPAKPRENAINK